MDKVIYSVAEETIIQILTYNGANFKAKSKMLMEKRKKLFWTPCATRCIDLIMEEIVQTKNVASMIKECRGITRFIYEHS